jgi:hypothetical protein
VRRSFSVEVKRSENKPKRISLRSEKKVIFSLVSLRSEILESTSEMKMNEAKKDMRNKQRTENLQKKMLYTS